MEVATGHYLNVYDKNRKRDIFVIFNEPNSAPTIEEVSILTELIERELENKRDREALREIIENTKLDCVQFGVQVIMMLPCRMTWL